MNYLGEAEKWTLTFLLWVISYVLVMVRLCPSMEPFLKALAL